MARRHYIALALPLVIGAGYALVHAVPFHAIIEWIRRLGVEGIAAFFAIFVLSNTLALPSTIVFVGAGLLYGTWWGTLLTTIGSLTVELLVIALVRTRTRRWFEDHAQHSEKLAAIEAAVSRDSFSVLWLLRLSPAIPFGLLNYALAPMRIPLRRRITAHILGMGPCNLAQAYIGSMLAGVDGLRKTAPGPWRWVLLGVGIVTAVAAFVITALASKRVLARERQDDGSDSRLTSHSVTTA